MSQERFNIVQTISYSSLSDFNYCPKYYQLVNIKRLKPFKNSPDTLFGTLIHNGVQSTLNGEKTEKEAEEFFYKRWKKLNSLYKLDEKYKGYLEVGSKIILYTKRIP